MCNFFSFCTMPDSTSDFYYFDWQMRQADKDGADSHSHICAHFGINEDKCNKYEYNPLTGWFTVDMRNAVKDDSKRAEKWVKRLDFQTVVEPLIIKPIVNPFELPKVSNPTDEQIGWLKEWSMVWDSAGKVSVDVKRELTDAEITRLENRFADTKACNGRLVEQLTAENKRLKAVLNEWDMAWLTDCIAPQPNGNEAFGLDEGLVLCARMMKPILEETRLLLGKAEVVR